mgnify:CR=1 FL=1
MSKLEKITQGLDLIWEDEIYDPCSQLPTLFEVDNIDEKWLPYLKALLGFTADIPFDATTEELRRILKVAVPYWNAKPAESGVIDTAVRMVTGNRFRVANYFDFRSIVGETVITEELEDFDPSLISFFAPTGSYPSGTSIDLGQTAADEFTLLGSGFPDLTTEDTDAYLVIDNDGLSPSNDGIWQISAVLSATSGRVLGAFPNPGAAVSADWKILFYMDEYITEVRLVDPGAGTLAYDAQSTAWTAGETVYGASSGANAVIVSDANSGATGTLALRSIFGRFENNETLSGSLGGDGEVKGELSGVLNRTLLSYLVGQVLPATERVNVVFINFLDQFLTPTDLDQWDASSGITNPDPGGAATVPAGETMLDDDDQGANWGDQTTAWKIEPVGSTTVARCVFMADTLSDCYYVQLDYGAKDLELYKRVSGTPTQLGSTVSLPFLKVGVQDVVRVDALAEGVGTRIRVKVDGDLKIDILDTPAVRTAGHVGFEAATAPCLLKLVEVNVLPTEILRIGLNP